MIAPLVGAPAHRPPAYDGIIVRKNRHDSIPMVGSIAALRGLGRGSRARTADLAAQAARAGLEPVIVKDTGATMYCWTDKSTGSLLTSRKCISQAGLPGFLELRAERRASMIQPPKQVGSSGQ